MSVRAMSFGGGVQSTAMLVLAAKGEIDFPVALFANVGDDSEHPAALEYIRNHSRPYAEKHGIEFVELRRHKKDGSEETIIGRIRDGSKSIGIPVRMNGSGAPGTRQCTQDFKIKVVAKELKRRGATNDDPATIALGISTDEFQRMRTSSGIPYELLSYPLIDLRLSRDDCKKITEDAGLPPAPKSSCWFCPFHRVAEWDRMRKDEPVLFSKSIDLERFVNERQSALGKDPVWFSSRRRPLDQAFPEIDQLSLFDDDGATCDIGGYCHS
jgi:hypothetical protein